MQLKSIPWWVWLVPIIVVLAATARLPYGYYTFTRIVVCGFGALVAFVGWEGSSISRAWSVVIALVAILFNPVIPVYLSRGTWFYLDIGTAAVFAAHMLFVRVGTPQIKKP